MRQHQNAHENSLDAHTFGVISAYAHETLPRWRLAKDLVIGKSGEVCSKSSYCGICRSQYTDCVLAQVVEEWIGDRCLGEMTGVGREDRTEPVIVELCVLPRAPVDLPEGEARRESVSRMQDLCFTG